MRSLVRHASLAQAFVQVVVVGRVPVGLLAAAFLHESRVQVLARLDGGAGFLSAAQVTERNGQDIVGVRVFRPPAEALLRPLHGIVVAAGMQARGRNAMCTWLRGSRGLSRIAYSSCAIPSSERPATSSL